MALRVSYRIATGQWRDRMRELYGPIAQTATAAMREGGDTLKREGRRNIAAAGFSKRWQNSFRVDVYPERGVSANAAIYAYHRIHYAGLFDRELLGRARGFLVAAFASTFLLLVLSAAMAIGISALTGIAWQTMVLATAPGSITEMALTAKILQECVALVTAFHVVRIFVILPSAPLIFAITSQFAGRPQPDGGRKHESVD